MSLLYIQDYPEVHSPHTTNQQPLQKEEQEEDPILLIRIENYPTKNLSEEVRNSLESWNTLPHILREAVVDAAVPGIKESDITVTCGSGHELEENKTLILIIEGLVDRPEHTKDIRDRLALKLAEATKNWLNPSWTVKVMIYLFNPKLDSYHVIKGAVED